MQAQKMRNIEDINLYDLVPESIRDDPDVSAAIQAVNGELQAVSNLCMVPALYSQIDSLSSGTLDHMAWELDAKVWRDTWPINTKRSVIKNVIKEKSKKGTLSAVQSAIESLGSAAVIVEWFDMVPVGTPHTFDITVTLPEIEGQVSAETQADLFAKIDDVKPVRSHYTFTLAADAAGELYLSGYARPAVYARLNTVEN
jgi:phage tail P2-like protein